MICPVCKRDLAPTLSICLTCGAMMNDTVREELQSKIARSIEQPRVMDAPVQDATSHIPAPPIAPPTAPPIASAAPLPIPVRQKPVTAGLANKDTSPTLIEFQNKNATLPDWRLKLQNSVRKRTNVTTDVAPSDDISTQTVQKPRVNNGAELALNDGPPIAAATEIKNEKVANALRRIEESRRTFAGAPLAAAAVAPAPARPATPNRSFPFNVVSKSADAAKTVPAKAPSLEPPKPKLVSSLRIEKKGFDTNKLPPIPQPAKSLLIEESVDEHVIDDTQNSKPELKFDRIQIGGETEEIEIVDSTEPEYEEIDDLAPLSMRFSAAIFDLIIGGFISAILLSPFLMSNVNLVSLSGFFAIAAGVLIVMFVYLTASIGFAGRTFGMRLFSLEIIDAEENELPTLHQAAVNSAVYLLSLALGGIGFLPALFNEERRAVHDILSGTILIREY